MLNPPPLSGWFFFFVFICAHLFSFIVSLYGFASVVLILLVLLFCSYYFCDGYENWFCLRAQSTFQGDCWLIADGFGLRFVRNPCVCKGFGFVNGMCHAGFVSFAIGRIK